MTEPKPLASLTAGLLARKGAARPAMRPQLVALHHGLPADLPLPAPAEAVWHDLGWNDMGADAAPAAPHAAPAVPTVVPIDPAAYFTTTRRAIREALIADGIAPHIETLVQHLLPPI